MSEHISFSDLMRMDNAIREALRAEPRTDTFLRGPELCLPTPEDDFLQFHCNKCGKFWNGSERENKGKDNRFYCPSCL